MSSVAPGNHSSPVLSALSNLQRLERYAHLLLCIVWVILGVHLMIADVWDETNGLAWLHNPQHSLQEKFTSIWTPPVAFFRPLPTLFAAMVIHFAPQDAIAWRVLRAANMVVMLATLLLLQRILWMWGGSQPGRRECETRPYEETPRASNTSRVPYIGEREVSGIKRLLLTVLVLYSGSACIVAGWYTNCFDAWALFFLVAGISCLTVHRPWWAGTLFATAVFCKETAILILPLLLLLYATQRVTIRELPCAALPALLSAACYFTLRTTLIDFASSHDIHTLHVADLWPTFVNFSESFWRQTMKLSGPPISGFVWLGLSLVTLCRWRARVGLVLFLVAIVPVYLGMFTMGPHGKLIHYWNFIGRLYLIPGVLVILFLMLEGRLWGVMLLVVPILSGAWVTYHDHVRFQQAYQQVHALALSTNERPLLIYTEEPLPTDTIREIRFGDFSEARWEFDCWSGTLRPHPVADPSRPLEQASPP